MSQPKLSNTKTSKKGDVRCILDASLLLETGCITLHPPVKHPNGEFTFGSIIGKPNEILLVAIE